MTFPDIYDIIIAKQCPCAICGANQARERNDIKILKRNTHQCRGNGKQNKLSAFIKSLGINARGCIICLIGSTILSFGLYNIHSLSGVTEGGVLGLTLLLQQWFDISPSLSGLILNAACYILGWRSLGKSFLAYSVVAAGGFSLSYKIFELFPPIFPQIAEMPFVAAIVGAFFVGIGVGLCVRVGGAPGGDDALALSLSKLLHTKIQVIYLASDLIVLVMSLSYIPLRRIAYSLMTVIISGQLIGIVQDLGKREDASKAAPDKVSDNAPTVDDDVKA